MKPFKQAKCNIMQWKFPGSAPDLEWLLKDFFGAPTFDFGRVHFIVFYVFYPHGMFQGFVFLILL